MKSLMPIVSGVLTYWTNKSFAPAVGVDANEIENFSFMQLALGALKVAHSKLL